LIILNLKDEAHDHSVKFKPTQLYLIVLAQACRYCSRLTYFPELQFRYWYRIGECEKLMKFHATILQSSKTATGIHVPDEIVTALGSGKHPKVKATINGYTYRSSIASMGGIFMLGVSAEVRKNAGVAGGDEVDVDVELDTEAREVVVPPDLAAALDKDTAAKTFFDGLSYSNKQRHVLAIEGAKSAETRQRRIEKSVSLFHEGKV